MFVFDPRGRGAVKAVPITDYAPYNTLQGPEAWLNYVEMLTGHTTLASRVYDVRRAVSFLEQFEGAAGRVAIRGHGIAALWGYLAAALDERIRAAHLTGMLPSWEEMVETRLFDSETITAAMALPGVLQHLDLPDLRQCFAGRELVLDVPLPVAAPRSSCPLPQRTAGSAACLPVTRRRNSNCAPTRPCLFAGWNRRVVGRAAAEGTVLRAVDDGLHAGRGLDRAIHSPGTGDSFAGLARGVPAPPVPVASGLAHRGAGGRLHLLLVQLAKRPRHLPDVAP